MFSRKLLKLMLLVIVAACLMLVGNDQVSAQRPPPRTKKKLVTITQADREAAAARAAKLGLKLGPAKKPRAKRPRDWRPRESPLPRSSQARFRITMDPTRTMPTAHSRRVPSVASRLKMEALVILLLQLSASRMFMGLAPARRLRQPLSAASSLA